MSIIDAIYYEQNPEELERMYCDYLAEYGLGETDFTLVDFRDEM